MTNEQLQYLKTVYNHVNGMVGMLTIPLDGSKAKQKMLLAEDVSSKTFHGENIFLTLNTFHTYRRINNLKSLNACYIDLDPYHIGKNIDDVLKQIRRKIYGRGIPYPTYEILSGHGAYLIWLITPESPKALSLWNKVQRALHDVLLPYGSDPKSLDAARVLRVPGSINAKNTKAVQVRIEKINQTTYQLQNLAEWLEIKTTITEKKKPHQPKTQNPRKKTRRFSYKPINKKVARNRAYDIESILIQKGTSVHGYREVGLFLYRHFLQQAGFSLDEALQKTIALNSKFPCPLTQKEAREATKTQDGVNYCPSNEWIIQQLDVPLSIQRTLITIRSKEAISAKRRKSLLPRKEMTAKKKKQILDLREKGYNITQTCKILGISRTTYYNLMHGRKPRKKKRVIIDVRKAISLSVNLLLYNYKYNRDINRKNNKVLPRTIKKQGQKEKVPGNPKQCALKTEYKEKRGSTGFRLPLSFGNNQARPPTAFREQGDFNNNEENNYFADVHHFISYFGRMRSHYYRYCIARRDLYGSG